MAIEAKMRASIELDNLIDAGANFRKLPDGMDGHTHPDVVDGFGYFDVIFKVGEQYYRGTINVKNNKRGRLFYSVTKTENIAQDIGNSYGKNPTVTFLRDASMDRVSQPFQKSQEKNFDRKEKYGVKNQHRENNPYSYESIISKPDMKVTSLKGNISGTRADVVAEAKKNASKIGKFNPQNGCVSVYVDDLMSDVLLGTDGLKHGLRRANKNHRNPNYSVTLQAGEILKNSVVINELNPKKEDASDGYVLLGMAKDANDNIYIVRSVINRFSNELTSIDVLYAINAKKESAAKKSPRFAGTPLSVTDSIISISDLLDYVNKYFPDVLSEDVLRHYGHTVRPTGELGDSVSIREPSLDWGMPENEKLSAMYRGLCH